jgi:amino acid permease
MNKIGIFSAVSMSFTFLAIIVILVNTGIIASKSPEEARADYGIELTEEDRDYVYFNGMMIPVVCAGLNSLFEGNQVILNIYSETTVPVKFFTQVLILVISLSIFVVLSVGLSGYLAFGNSVKSVVIYSLPHQDVASIIIKFCYLITISGSYLIIIQPIFHIIESCECYRSGNCCIDRPRRELEDVDVEWSCTRYFKFILVRFLIVIIVFFVSILIPNINIMLIISGAFCGTLVNIIIPVTFYNRAYNGSIKNENMHLDEDGNQQPEEGRMCMKVMGYILLVVGTTVGIWGLVYVFFNFADAPHDKV